MKNLDWLDLITLLREHGACQAGLDWLGRHSSYTLREALQNCPIVDWLAWAVVNVIPLNVPKDVYWKIGELFDLYVLEWKKFERNATSGEEYRTEMNKLRDDYLPRMKTLLIAALED